MSDISTYCILNYPASFTQLYLFFFFLMSSKPPFSMNHSPLLTLLSACLLPPVLHPLQHLGLYVFFPHKTALWATQSFGRRLHWYSHLSWVDGRAASTAVIIALFPLLPGRGKSKVANHLLLQTAGAPQGISLNPFPPLGQRAPLLRSRSLVLSDHGTELKFLICNY